METIINRKRYNTQTATLLAHDRYWDGHNMERDGRNTFLYRAPRGSYFSHHTTLWQGEMDTIVPLDDAEAESLYESLPEKEVAVEEAFPNIQIEEA